MKIILKKETAESKSSLCTTLFQSSVYTPSLNKFEIISNSPEIYSDIYQKESFYMLSNIIKRNDFHAENLMNPQLVKFQDKIPKFEFSDMTLNFRTFNSKLLESIDYRWKIEKDQENVKLFKFPLQSIAINHFSILEEKLTCYQLIDLPWFNTNISNDNKFKELSYYQIQLNLGKELKELNDYDIISEILKLDFQDHKYLKVRPLKFPKRWKQNSFVPASVVKWKKGLDLDLNWNYVSDLKDLYGSRCHVLDLEWETEQQDDCLSVKLHDVEQEITISQGETQDVIATDQIETLVEDRSCIDTQFLVDRFMVKRGRSNNFDQDNYVKKPKIQVNQISIEQDFKLHHQKVEQVVEIECPKFDTENAIKFKYIANSKFFSRRELVALLESKFKIELVERDFEYCDSIMDREDIIVDHNTCIIIHSLTDLLCPDADNIIDSVKQTVVGQKLVGLCLRYSNIFILLSEVDLEKPDSRVLLSKMKIDPFTPPIMKSLIAFYQLAYSLETLIDRKIQIFLASTYERVAWWIRSIGEKQASSLQAVSLHAWSSRSFIKETESPAERFLSMFPVINSFQAQIMLSQMSLREIINLPKADLVDKFRNWIPEKSLLILFSMTHMKLEMK